MNLFRSKPKPQPPPKVPSDEVIPLHYLDDQFYTRALVLHFFSRFDDVLDPEKLRKALVRLLHIGGWRKLGARLRLNDAGRLEYHVPAEYTAERPPFSFTRVNTGISIEEHSIARRIPRNSSGSQKPVLFEDAAHFRDLISSPDTPTKLEDWLYTDKPPLSLHIVTFTDATVVGLSWSHTLLDAMGRHLLQRAWTAVLEGREHDVPPFQGYYEDPITPVVNQTPPEQHVLYDQLLSGFGFFVFVMYMILEFVWWPKQSSRIILLPGAHVQDLRQQALQDLQAKKKEGNDDDDREPFVSEGDIIFAWLARKTIQALRPSPTTPVNLTLILNLRGSSSASPLFPHPEGEAYIANAALASTTLTTADDLLHDERLSKTAAQIRRDLEIQRTRENLQAFLSLHYREVRAKGGHSPLFGPRGQLMLSLSNWHRGRFFEQDFSAAAAVAVAVDTATATAGITKDGGGGGRDGDSGRPLETTRAEKIGRPSFVGVTGHENGFQVRNAGPCLGRDAKGDWWVSWALRDEAWGAFERALRDGS
ncbi:hypothetical protein D0869_13587 [Hortaea werneckii]|uniref:Uncharacterized protein n=1 Tax=Hortaea werneckii TaxID=91943 RepID=A0A3M6Y7E1_HORWE|nr:hypothetical protein KC355_g6740 [Hortaea werneckii]KAI7186716.1 hypothetical protein KC324_g7087 [Hortaea werneckii]KAI7576394.1 hypothetical protein KC316_g10717 [Hortaea werneckii]KAI7663333.1 hypothetical protein KC318_g8366 [Hortaea werneckii]RMX73457.1 hypothetical protein D0869_13587 [Hortaea werneckii]